jgi:glycosyltransferase involved in cell wall biosynthesis
MKILYTHERLGSLAGAEANALITGRELTKKGHQLGILHGPSTGKNLDAWNEAFPEQHPWDVTSGSSSIHSTLKALKGFKPDLIYIHKLSDLPALETLSQSGIPIVRMIHDHDMYCMRSYKYNYFTREICRKPASAQCIFPCLASVVRNPGEGFPLKWVSLTAKKKEIKINQSFARMVVVTEFMKEELLTNGFDEQKIEIHAPVPLMGDPSIRSTFSDRNLILYAGQIIRGKGVDLLIKALSKLSTNFECIILGSGSHKPYCEALSRKLGLEDKVHFKGFIPQEELKGYYRETSVVALSSIWPEPIATIGLEVMRYGLPVVAFDAGGIKDWLKDGENGYLVPWADTEAFASKLEFLLNNKEKAKILGLNGLEFVNKTYDFDEYINDLESLFANVVKNSHA